MSAWLDRQPDLDDDDEAPAGPIAPAIAPGRRTLTMRLAERAPRVVQRVATGPAASPSAVAIGAHGPGQPLPGPLAAQMSRAFAGDLSAVRVHEGSHVSALGARAYALGDEIHFAPGQFAPDTVAGRELIGHELAHVVQQRQGRVGGGRPRAGVAIADDPALEAQADRAGARAARGDLVGDGLAGITGPTAPTSAAIQRQIIVGPAVASADAKGRAIAGAEANHLFALACAALEVDADSDQGAHLARLVGPGRPDDGDRYRVEVAHGTSDAAIVAELCRRVRAFNSPLKHKAGDEDRADAADAKAPKRFRSAASSAGVSSVEATTASRIKTILGELLSSGRYVFSNPPLNSSGDIYHTVGFLAVLRAAELPLPTIVLGHYPEGADGGVTRLQAERGRSFAVALGFGDQVRMLEVAPKKPKGAKKAVKHLTVATSQTRKAIAEDKLVAPILDQKSSTALIGLLMQTLGVQTITDMIRPQLTTYAAAVPAATQVASTAWIDAQLARIAAVTGPKKRLVLLNRRVGGSQDQHNSSGADFDALRAMIDADPTLAHYTLASGGTVPQADAQAASPSFAEAGADGQPEAAGFNTKVQHLQLLARIKQVYGDRLVGIYGSTSGTTDAPALIGIPTLSLHHFASEVGGDAAETSDAKADANADANADAKDGKTDAKAKAKAGVILNEQDQRELLMVFKQVVPRGDVEVAKKAMKEWLAGSYVGPALSGVRLDALKPVFQGGQQPAALDKKGKARSTPGAAVALPAGVLEALRKILDPMRGGLDGALAALAPTGLEAGRLRRGTATGNGMNCLIHTLVQLAGGADAPAGAQVAAIRQNLVAVGAAVLDEMLDPYAPGGAASMMLAFRTAHGFSTQILQWQGGQLLVHPQVGQGAVRLLLHSGNHFEPVWNNGGVAVPATAALPVPAAGAPFATQLQAAIMASLAPSDGGKDAKGKGGAADAKAQDAKAAKASDGGAAAARHDAPRK